MEDRFQVFRTFSYLDSRPNIPILKNIKKAMPLISKVNEISMQHLENSENLGEEHLSLYCAGITVTEFINRKLIKGIELVNNQLKKESQFGSKDWKRTLTVFDGK